jgi:hypothetical protein
VPCRHGLSNLLNLNFCKDLGRVRGEERRHALPWGGQPESRNPELRNPRKNHHRSIDTDLHPRRPKLLRGFCRILSNAAFSEVGFLVGIRHMAIFLTTVSDGMEPSQSSEKASSALPSFRGSYRGGTSLGFLLFRGCRGFTRISEFPNDCTVAGGFTRVLDT